MDAVGCSGCKGKENPVNIATQPHSASYSARPVRSSKFLYIDVAVSFVLLLDTCQAAQIPRGDLTPWRAQSWHPQMRLHIGAARPQISTPSDAWLSSSRRSKAIPRQLHRSGSEGSVQRLQYTADAQPIHSRCLSLSLTLPLNVLLSPGITSKSRVRETLSSGNSYAPTKVR